MDKDQGQQLIDQQQDPFADPAAIESLKSNEGLVQDPDNSGQEVKDAIAEFADEIQPPAGDDAPPPAKTIQYSDDATPGEGTDGDSEVESPQFSDDALVRAGLSAEEASKYFKDEESLEAALRLQDSQALWHASQRAPQQTQQVPQQTHQVPQQTMPVQHVPQDRAPVQADQLIDVNDLDEDEWGPETVKLLKGLDSQYKSQIEEARMRSARAEAIVNQLVRAQHQQHEQAIHDAFDQQVNALPEQYRETFGRGTRYTLAGTPHLQNRIRLSQTMDELTRGRAMQGLPAMTDEQLMHRAIRAEFPNLNEQAIRKDVTEKVQRRQNMQTSPPSKRHGSPLTGTEKAEKRVGEMLAKHGIPANDWGNAAGGPDYF